MAFSKLILALALIGSATAARVDAGSAVDILDAIAAGADEVSLTSNVVMDKGQCVDIEGSSKVVGNGFKITAKGANMFKIKEGGTLSLEGVTLKFDSDEKKLGGCVSVEAGGSFTASGVTFDECEAYGDGGGVNAMAGAKEVTIADSEFKECKSEKGAGGGVSSMAAKTTITGTTFSENRAKGYGAALAISALGGEAEVNDCTFTKNGGGKGRSAIYLNGLEELEFVNSMVSENSGKGAGVVILSKLTDATFAANTFSNNKDRAIRAFQLFDGTVMFNRNKFQNNVADAKDYAMGGAAVFVKESPHSRIVFQDTRFLGNKVDYGSDNGYGGALYLSANAELMGCTFDGNAASVGGAVYVCNGVTDVKIDGTDFSNNEAKVAGGAIAAKATSSDSMFPGTISLTGVTGSGNKVGMDDMDKTGGSFLKLNGGTVTMRDTSVDGVVGLRLANAKIYNEVSTGGFTVADNADVDVYCGGEVSVKAIGSEDEDEAADVTETGFNALGSFTIEEHEGCPAAAGSTCEDSATWEKKDEEGKTCSWVADKPKTRCAAKGDDGTFGFESCPDACGVCGKTCADDDSWTAKDDDKDCAWAKRFINRCAARDEDGMFGYEACAKSCHACDASA